MAEGTSPNEGCSSWVLEEAECSDLDGSLEQLFDGSTDTDVSDLLDDTDCHQGNSLALHNALCQGDYDREITVLKRKHLESPNAIAELSPRLQSISLSPRHRSKRRLFPVEDSGVELSVQHEAEDNVGQTPEQVESANGSPERTYGGAEAILRSSNQRATLLCKFKELVGVSYTELTRTFRSNKTCYTDWVVCVCGVTGPVSLTASSLLTPHCEYLNLTVHSGRGCILVVFLARFRTSKSRETVCKLVKALMDVRDAQIMAQPPKIKSVPAALYWYKCGIGNGGYIHGPHPEWIMQQTMISHKTGEEARFSFGDMVQWAYDNDLRDECQIAYEYARLATEDSNALAWLECNNQAKFVKDCARMVGYYKRAEMQNMTMAAWIHRQIKDRQCTTDWKVILNFLKYQHVEVIIFLNAMMHLLRGTPKKNCMVLYGPPNTGKSMFAMSLMQCLKGRVLSYVNSRSQFWLQPLADAKIALLDDATRPCWDYIDIHLRNALDGNPICLDCKHKAPVQVKCPPLIVTTNVDIHADDRWRYLWSRVKVFKFGSDMPLNDDGTPTYNITDAHWQSFFQRLWRQLDLSDQEDEGDDGETGEPLRCGARGTANTI